ncbi:dipeptide/oligopeptide/nickel ABC transporter ATP-binding protein [Ruminococcus sp.]|uniref:ABC transporter ATP-binding protein n=1 Tax=Ruminococcus sp. TaxID=41978 RepID=UPI0025F255A4|nr:dipeptide/oligopeptide/nickel ABC transporter ATP-binding protein [Ruminococcus sp.]MBQ6250853.1 ABC transporter ATP-binding protein [Ruminococcus sp.]
MLKAENVTKKYGSQTAVNGVSLELEDNAVTVIVGESGSGKSTLARILSLTEKPDSGRILLGDTEADRRYAKSNRRLVQLVMQNAASSLDPHQSARQIIDEPLKLLMRFDRSQRIKRIDELCDMVQFPRDKLNNKVAELSGGQQKRLCIARALATEPRYIIFDEAFSGLDVTLRRCILTMLKKLRAELKTAFLIITHDLDTAMFMADRIYVMRSGNIIETLDRPHSFLDFKEDYSKELVRAAEYKRQVLQ